MELGEEMLLSDLTYEQYKTLYEDKDFWDNKC
jgi:hypothetical protein